MSGSAALIRKTGHLTGWNWAVLGIVVVLLFVALDWARPPAVQQHNDTVRDLLAAREMRDSGVFTGLGARTSFAGIHQGGTWNLYLSVLDAVGLGVDGICFVGMSLAALSVLMVMIVGWTMCGLLGALWAGVAGGAFLVLESNFWYAVTNPSLLPLPAAVFLVSVMLYTRSRKWLDAVAAAFCLAVMVLIHPASVFVAPGFAVVLLLKPRKRSLGAVILTALVVGSVVLFFSGGALVMSIVDFSLSPGGSAGGGGGGLATGWWWLMAGGGGAVTAWFVVPETTRRSPLFTAVLVTTSCAFASNLLLGLIMGVAPRGAYLASFYPGVAVLVSASLVGIWAKVCKKLELSVRTNLFSGQVAAVMAALLLAAVAVFGLSPRYVADPFFSFYEIEILAAELKKEGITSQESARAVLRSPGVLSLHSGLSLFLPKESADARPRDKALVALRLPGGKDVAAPAGGRLLAGADKTSLIVFPMLESISWDSFEVKSDSTPGGRWLTGALEINPQQSGPGYPEIVGLSSHDVSTGCVSYRFRVVPVGNMSRVLAVAGHCPGLGSEIRMLQVTGLRASVAGPDKVVLESGQRHSSGWLELTLCRERWRQTYDMIPFIFEFSQDDTEATELAKQINICGEGP